MPLPALHLRLVQAIVKIVNAPDLSLRGRFAPVAISGRHLQFVQAAVKNVKADCPARRRTCSPYWPPLKRYKPIASVAALSERLVQGNSIAWGYWCTTALT